VPFEYACTDVLLVSLYFSLQLAGGFTHSPARSTAKTTITNRRRVPALDDPQARNPEAPEKLEKDRAGMTRKTFLFPSHDLTIQSQPRPTRIRMSHRIRTSYAYIRFFLSFLLTYTAQLNPPFATQLVKYRLAHRSHARCRRPGPFPAPPSLSYRGPMEKGCAGLTKADTHRRPGLGGNFFEDRRLAGTSRPRP
jgi:hypothetical protein